MAFTVNEFRSQMQFDGARPNLFRCRLSFPAALTLSSVASTQFSFMARQAQLPGSTVNQISQFYFGRELKFSGNRTFPEWTVTIVNDEDFTIRKTFERWLNALNSHAGNLRNPNFINPEQYQVDGFVDQFSKVDNQNSIKTYKFIGMFPIDVSPIELDWGANDTIEEFSVTFAYQWWESVPETDETSTAGAAAGGAGRGGIPPVGVGGQG